MLLIDQDGFQRMLGAFELHDGLFFMLCDTKDKEIVQTRVCGQAGLGIAADGAARRATDS